MMAAEVLDIPDEEYFADRSAVSHHELEHLRASEEEFERVVLRGHDAEDKAAYRQGRELHEALLQPGPIGSRVTMIPAGVLDARGYRSGKAWKLFAQNHPHRVLFKPNDWRLPVLERCREHDKARELLECPGQRELVIRWYDDETGVKRKAKLDKLCDGPVPGLAWQGPVIIDVKKDIDPRPHRFANTMAEYGYHRQAATYSDAVFALHGVRVPVIFIACGPQWPNRVETVNTPDEYLAIGRRQNRTTLTRYAECRASGIWRSATHGLIVDVQPPKWLNYED